MPAAKEFYVAIELGSSKITGIAGQKKMDGSISVLAIASEQAPTCIRKGVVYNIDKTNQCIRSIIRRLQEQLQTEITLVHVGIGGQGIRSVVNTIVRDLDEATVVNNSIIDHMMDGNRGTHYQGKTILDVAPQEYKVDSQFQLDPVGIECNRIEGNFLNIVWRESFYRNLSKCFEQEKMPNPRYYLAPIALADSILTESEKRTGCILVDLGAETTTVSVYYKNILRHLVTVPMGGWNITKDITSFHIDEMEAEKMKLKYASALTNSSDVDPDMKLSIDPQRSVPQREFISIVEARAEEIIKNTLAQIPSEYIDKLVGGIVLTGGGCNMKNIELAFRKYSNIDKIRIAKAISGSVNTAKSVNIEDNATLCTALALLAKADDLSSGRPLSEVRDIFSEENETTNGTAGSRSISEMKPGQVPTVKEREAAEEEARRKAEEEARRKAEEEAARKEEEERRRRENSASVKIKRGIVNFFKKMTEPEE
ncbi:MAG: cell division protein FtsA [Bacteroidales bacterium]|nr:cell division protein FtsA [Bacteroidales bacterium]MCM1146901.1 cell division protein FtsA [Bacteroidales bacterium]MCM1205601.1 cell division protein FtsA [Bacillota bacterium]MCM1510288.1 cell division protein FtsA [Clostridium sp.]